MSNSAVHWQQELLRIDAALDGLLIEPDNREETTTFTFPLDCTYSLQLVSLTCHEKVDDETDIQVSQSAAVKNHCQIFPEPASLAYVSHEYFDGAASFTGDSYRKVPAILWGASLTDPTQHRLRNVVAPLVDHCIEYGNHNRECRYDQEEYLGIPGVAENILAFQEQIPHLTEEKGVRVLERTVVSTVQGPEGDVGLHLEDKIEQVPSMPDRCERRVVLTNKGIRYIYVNQATGGQSLTTELSKTSLDLTPKGDAEKHPISIETPDVVVDMLKRFLPLFNQRR